MDKFTQIYLVENCYGDPNKVYVGKEKSHQKTGREYFHGRTFGLKIDFNYIDKVEGWDKKGWKPLETFWIQYFKFLGFEVLNENNGGGGPSFQTKEARLKMSKSRKGYIHSEESRQKMRKPHIGSGGIKGVSKPKGFGKKISKIKLALNIKLSQETKDKISIAKTNHESYKNPKRGEKIAESKFKPVIQNDIQGNFIQEFKSCQEAAKIMNIHKSTIWKHLDGRSKTCVGFIFKFK